MSLHDIRARANQFTSNSKLGFTLNWPSCSSVVAFFFSFSQTTKLVTSTTWLHLIHECKSSKMINLHQQQTSNKNPYVNTFNRAPKMDTQAATQHHARDRQPFNTHWQQTKVEPSPSVEESQQVQKKLFRLFYVYAILIVSLYATYAGYYFYQQHSRHQQHHPQDVSATATTTETLLKSQQPLQLSLANESPGLEEQQRINFESKFESKIHLLERYIEVIALDLQETKNKLKEREKCDCNISCSFNGTRYADRSSWQNQCDICTCLVSGASISDHSWLNIYINIYIQTNLSCSHFAKNKQTQSGSISCLPKKCPPVNCDDAIQLPAQCCPTCMSKFRKCCFKVLFY